MCCGRDDDDDDDDDEENEDEAGDLDMKKTNWK